LNVNGTVLRSLYRFGPGKKKSRQLRRSVESLAARRTSRARRSP